jgi:hypothetical protein
MSFLLYTDKSSLRKKTSRLLQGGVSEFNDTYIGWWERDILDKDDITDIVYQINKVYEGKPDLIAYDYYGKNGLGWLVLQYNDIVDINEELMAGKMITLPSKSRVFYKLLSRPVGAKRVSR